VTFITYGLTDHELSAANIFAALQLFNVIKYPLQQLGMQLSAVMDCVSALGEHSVTRKCEFITDLRTDRRDV
jgi:hypothetical protein